MSLTVPLGKKSFADSRQLYNKLAPPPKYFTDEYLLREFGENLPTEKDDVFTGFEFPE